MIGLLLEESWKVSCWESCEEAYPIRTVVATCQPMRYYGATTGQWWLMMTSQQDTDSSTRGLQDCVGWYRQSGVSSYGACSNGSCEMDAEYGSSVVGLELRTQPLDASLWYSQEDYHHAKVTYWIRMEVMKLIRNCIVLLD